MESPSIDGTSVMSIIKLTFKSSVYIVNIHESVFEQQVGGLE